MHSTRNDIPKAKREKLVTLLNATLADCLDLKMQAKQAHWNVKGPSFIALHELFDKVAAEVDDYADTLAERATALGGVALGTVKVVASKSRLDDYPLDLSDGPDHVKALATVMAAFGKTTRAAIEAADTLDDADSADVLTEVSRGIDKLLWFVEAHVQAKS